MCQEARSYLDWNECPKREYRVVALCGQRLSSGKCVAFLQRNSSGLFVRERQLCSDSIVITMCTKMMFDLHTKQESPSSTCNVASETMGKSPPLVRLAFVDKDHW